MSYCLSILDKSPIPEAASALQAVATTLAYAALADRLGYHRFWVAEHHGSPGLASVAPEILTTHLLATTSRIRIGTGGVLLQHYSPYKVAEQFALLAALAPGRVDLGIGKAPGGLPAGTRALQAEFASPRIPFEAKLRDLDGFLRDALPPGHVLAQSRLGLYPPSLPQRFLLGASESSARLAAEVGWGFVHAGHQDGDAAAIERSLAIAGQNVARPILAVTVFAADNAEQARRVGEQKVFKLEFADGQSVKLGSAQAVQEFERQRGERAIRVQEQHPQVITGTGGQVHEQLQALARRHGVDEFIIDSPVAEPQPRLRSIELIAAAALRAAA